MMRNPLRVMAASTLVLEAFAVFFAALALGNLKDGGTQRGQVLAAVGALSVLLVLCSGLLRRPWGYLLGSGLQVAVLAVGFWLPMMFVVGAMFVALWVASLWVGRKVERERAAFVAAGSAP